MDRRKTVPKGNLAVDPSFLCRATHRWRCHRVSTAALVHLGSSVYIEWRADKQRTYKSRYKGGRVEKILPKKNKIDGYFLSCGETQNPHTYTQHIRKYYE